MPSDLVACRLTPDLPAAIATIGVQGAKAVSTVLACCRLKVDQLDVGRIHYGLWQVGQCDITSEQVVICRTKENVLEIHCHGGTAMCRALLKSLESVGCKIISSEVWREMDPESSQTIIAEAEADLLTCTTDRAAAVLLDQLNGAWNLLITQFRELAVQGRRAEAETLLAQTLEWAAVGAHLTKPWRIVLAGPPNAGKSSLVNALTGQDKSIGHAQAGTTRDWLDATTAIDGWPVLLTDTAGIRESDDGIEQAGVYRAWRQVELADLVVLLVDVQVGWTEVHDQLLSSFPNKCLLAINKLDLAEESQVLEAQSIPNAKANRLKQVRISCVTAPGTQPLMEAITETLFSQEPSAGTAIPFRQRHLPLLRNALAEAKSGKLEKASYLLSSLIG